MIEAARILLESALKVPAAYLYRKQLEAKRFEVPKLKVAVNYGNVLPREGIVNGGRVKLLHLHDRFPESEDFNVLYLVSSALPEHAVELAKWARSRGARLVWNQNGVGFPGWAGPRTCAVNRPMAAILKMADFVIYQSQFCQQAADQFLGKPTCPSSVLFNPVDVRRFSPPRKPLNQGVWQLLTAGTHNQAERVMIPLEALRILQQAGHDVHLTVAGAMRWRGADEEVDAFVRRHHLERSVSFVPPFTQGEALELYQGAHILLHPKYHDPCPTVVLEALSCGLPVVCSRSGGMPELIGSGKAGVLLPVTAEWERPYYPAPASVAGAVERVMSQWSEHSDAARERAVRLFDKENWVQRHVAIFMSLLR